MRLRMLRVILGSCALAVSASQIARADCESDMVQLEEAYKTPGLSAEAKAALDKAKTKSVAAMKKDDDTGCHQAIADSMSKAGIPIK
jgi:hypothetical protein